MAFVLCFVVSLKGILQDILPNIFKEPFLPLHICSSCLHCTSMNGTSIKNWKKKSFKLLTDFAFVYSHSQDSVTSFQLGGYQMC